MKIREELVIFFEDTFSISDKKCIKRAEKDVGIETSQKLWKNTNTRTTYIMTVKGERIEIYET